MIRGALLPFVMLVLGIAILVRTLTLGGGPVATGILVGALFVAAGAGRLWFERKTAGTRDDA